MKVMCFTEEEIADVLQVIAGVLQLGNVNFMAAGGAQVAEKSGKSETETDGVYSCVHSVRFCLKSECSIVLAMQCNKARVIYLWPYNVRKYIARDGERHGWSQQLESLTNMNIYM